MFLYAAGWSSFLCAASAVFLFSRCVRIQFVLLRNGQNVASMTIMHALITIADTRCVFVQNCSGVRRRRVDERSPVHPWRNQGEHFSRGPDVLLPHLRHGVSQGKALCLMSLNRKKTEKENTDVFGHRFGDSPLSSHNACSRGRYPTSERPRSLSRQNDLGRYLARTT